MSKARWTDKMMKDANRVEKDGVYVRVSSLVAKGKVDKIEPNVNSFPLPPDLLLPAQIGINRLDGTVEDLSDLSLVERAGVYQMQIDECNRKIRSHVNHAVSMVNSLIEAEKERVANPNRPYVHIESDAITLPTGERLYIKHEFDLPPFPAPRMTRSDQWKTDPNHHDPAKRQRKPVTRYFAWRDAFVLMCNQKGYTLQERLHVVFIMPMPKYFSRKKREIMNGQAHKQRPDTDNCIKSIKDAFSVDDGFVWDERGIKVWGDKGKILILI